MAVFDEMPKRRGKDAIRCLEYELDETKPKIYQNTFDVSSPVQDASPELLEAIAKTRQDLLIQCASP